MSLPYKYILLPYVMPIDKPKYVIGWTEWIQGDRIYIYGSSAI